MTPTHARTPLRRPLRSPLLRTLGVLLSVAVIAVHVKDQGGLTAMTTPTWLGWAYRALEVGAALVGLALLARLFLRFTWSCALLVGLGPLLGYVLTRTTGLPQAHDDIGNWSDPLGIASLVIEGLLILTALLAMRPVRRERTAAGSAYPAEPATTGTRPQAGARVG